MNDDLKWTAQSAALIHIVCYLVAVLVFLGRATLIFSYCFNFIVTQVNQKRAVLFIYFLTNTKQFDDFNIQVKSNPAKVTNVCRVSLPAWSSGFKNIIENLIIFVAFFIL